MVWYRKEKYGSDWFTQNERVAMVSFMTHKRLRECMCDEVIVLERAVWSLPH